MMEIVFVHNGDVGSRQSWKDMVGIELFTDMAKMKNGTQEGNIQNVLVA